MMQTDCLLQDFILKETKGGALQRESENENECEEKKRVIMSAFAPILTLFFVAKIGEVSNFL